MATQKEINSHAKLIIEANGGRVWFNLTQARQITGYGENSIAPALNGIGALVKPKGRQKMVSALDLAKLMLSGNKAAVD